MGSIAMKTADHLLLGQYLVERCGTPHLRCHRRAFLLGCVEPDYNVFSYLRGMRYYEKFRGHNAENSSAFLSHCFTDFEGHTLHSAWDYFRLGTMIHYAADAFTAPHNNFWTGTLSEHCAYEAALHQKFERMLATAHPEQIPYWEYALLHRSYCREAHGMETDFQYILTACLSLLKKYSLQIAEPEGDCYEDFDHYQLVQASH